MRGSLHAPTLVWRHSHIGLPQHGPVPHLQVGDVAVNVHGGRLTVLRDVLIVLWAWLPIHTIDAGDGHILIAPGYIPTEGADEVKVGARAISEGLLGARAPLIPAHAVRLS